MYCNSCGAALADGVVFCKHCGTASAGAAARAQLPANVNKLSETTIVFAVMTALVGLGGLFFVYLLVHRLLMGGTDPTVLVLLALAALAAVILLAGLLGRQTTRVLDAYLRASGARPDPATPAPSLPLRDTAQLEAPREPAASVTDHTTRTFDSVYAEQGRKQ